MLTTPPIPIKSPLQNYPPLPPTTGPSDNGLQIVNSHASQVVHQHHHRHQLPHSFPALPLLRRRPSLADLRAMFHSHRGSHLKRRYGDPRSFDQSWRRRKTQLVHVPAVASDDNLGGEPAQKKRFNTSAAHERASGWPADATATSPRPQSGRFDSRTGQSENEIPKREKRIDSAVADAEGSPASLGSEHGMLTFTADLRAGLDDSDDEQDEAAGPKSHPKQFIPHAHAFIRHDSYFLNPCRPRLYTIPTPKTRFSVPATTRAELLRIAQRRNMSRPEIALRREIFYRERYLISHKAQGGTRAYRQMAVALTRNRRHLMMLKRRGVGWRDLPEGVRRWIWEIVRGMEEEEERREDVDESALV